MGTLHRQGVPAPGAERRRAIRHWRWRHGRDDRYGPGAARTAECGAVAVKGIVGGGACSRRLRTDGGNRDAMGARAAGGRPAEGDAEGAEAAGLAADRGRGHDDARGAAHGGAGGDGVGEQPPAPVSGRGRAGRRPAAARRGRGRGAGDGRRSSRRAACGRSATSTTWATTGSTQSRSRGAGRSSPAGPIRPAPPARAPARRRNSGGPWGFADLLAAVADPADERHAEVSEWLGEFDPAAFSVEAAEARVRAWFAPKRGRRPRGKG